MELPIGKKSLKNQFSKSTKTEYLILKDFIPIFDRFLCEANFD
jgi:hypothetical protein